MLMTKTAAQRFPAPALDTLPDDIRTRLLTVQEKSGFVPNDPVFSQPPAKTLATAEAPMLQPSMGLDPDRFSLLKKPLR